MSQLISAELSRHAHAENVEARSGSETATKNSEETVTADYANRADVIVDDLIIVDPKVVVAFSEAHVAQMIGCLAITNLRLALLLNFKHATLEWKRVVREFESVSAPSA